MDHSDYSLSQLYYAELHGLKMDYSRLLWIKSVLHYITPDYKCTSPNNMVCKWITLENFELRMNVSLLNVLQVYYSRELQIKILLLEFAWITKDYRGLQLILGGLL